MSIINGLIQFAKDYPIYVIANVFIFLIWCAFMDMVLERCRKYWVCVLVRILMTFGYFAPELLPFMSTARMFILIFLLVFQAVYLYRGKLQRKILVVAIIFLTMMTAELLSMYLFYTPEYMQLGIKALPAGLQIVSYAEYIFVNIAILSSVAVIMRRINNKRKYPPSYSLAFVIPFTLEIALLYAWSKTLTGENPTDTVFLIVIIFMCIVGNLAVFMTITTTQERRDLKAENDALEKLVKAQTGYYSALSEQYENIRKMRHDIANHMYTINILLKDGKSEETAEYAKELSEKNQYSSRLGDCRNSVLDAYLYNRMQELEANGIKTEVKITLPQELNISNCDLISVFGNLLDNAAEACAGIDDAEISVVAELRKNYMYVSVENPAVKTSEAKTRRIPELERGLGNRILMNLAEKYDGEFTKAEKDGIYTAKILLRVCTSD